MIVDFMDYILQVWINLYDGKMKEEIKISTPVAYYEMSIRPF